MQIFSVQPSRCGTFSPVRRAILVAAVLGVALSGCSRGTQGIFATIEIEEKTNTSNLVDNTTINGLVLTESRIIALAGTKIFTRTISGSDWGEISSPNGFSASAVGGINADGSDDGLVDEVYASFYNRSATRYYMYRLDLPALEWTAVDTEIWNPDDGRVIDGMIDVHDRMLMSTRQSVDQLGELWSFGAGLNDPALLGEFGVLTDAAWNGSSAVVVSATPRSMRHVSDLSAGGSLTIPPVAAVPNVTGVGVFPDPVVRGARSFAITTLNGDVWVSTDGVAENWQKTNGRLEDRSLSDIEWVENASVLVIGTQSDEGFGTSSRGYFESIAPTGSDYTLSLTNEIASSYTGSELSTAAITRFRYYPAPVNTLFALTNGLGLWSGVYSSPRNPSWTWE
jgi:hypothetical protein